MDKSNSLKIRAVQFLLKASRLLIFQPFVRYFFSHMTHLLPAKKIKENKHWIAFFHPKPDYPLHILILPKRGIRSMMTLPDDDLELGSDLFLIVKELITQFHLAEKGYRLITNGGSNQTIPQWHWHLVSDAGTE